MTHDEPLLEEFDVVEVDLNTIVVMELDDETVLILENGAVDRVRVV